ncbi:MAG TPA: metallophosphoesterase [Chloroflexota bacterium]|nr:metallophosphoesterase [Chloroflexota bacterium]
MTRLAAVADVHVNESSRADWRELVDRMSALADVLILAGDLTNRGLPREAEVLVEGLSHARIPVVGILGNHDFESGQQDQILRLLCDAGTVMLDEEPHEVGDVGFAGVKGFCGGFDQHALAPFGEDAIKQFVRETVDDTLRLESGLSRLRTRHKIVVLHYAPIRRTVEGEPLEIYPFLGSSRLADPLDHFDVTAAFHGHAHHGSPEGATSRGVPVYNVALPLMRELDPGRPFRILEL